MTNFNITYNYDPQTKQYIAEIPQLNLSDFGDTIDEAEKNVKEALKAYLEEVYRKKNDLHGLYELGRNETTKKIKELSKKTLYKNKNIFSNI